jgi:hypothetical protein
MRTGIALAIILLGAVVTTDLPAPAAAEESNDFMNSPEWLATKYVGAGQWQELDALIEKLAASGERAEDGRYRLYLVTSEIQEWLGLWNQEQDSQFQQGFAEYRKGMPASAFASVLAVMQVHAAAWRARGTGYASTVTPEGWALFKERNQRAWQMLLACKSSSGRLPIWYELAIKIAADAGVPQREQDAIFKEGIQRFPGYHSIYFTYTRQFSPLWGGDYESADAFIRGQAAAAHNQEGDVLYARLYWLLDQLGNGDADFFVESLVDWQRMRGGFELLMKQFSASAWNQANFTAFACRANDAPTYWKLRKKVDRGQFQRAAPRGISLEVCDERFTVRS